MCLNIRLCFSAGLPGTENGSVGALCRDMAARWSLMGMKGVGVAACDRVGVQCCGFNVALKV